MILPETYLIGYCLKYNILFSNIVILILYSNIIYLYINILLLMIVVVLLLRSISIIISIIIFSKSSMISIFIRPILIIFHSRHTNLHSQKLPYRYEDKYTGIFRYIR